MASFVILQLVFGSKSATSCHVLDACDKKLPACGDRWAEIVYSVWTVYLGWGSRTLVALDKHRKLTNACGKIIHNKI